MGEKEVLEQAEMLIVTKGEKGCSVITKTGQVGRGRRARRARSPIRPASATRSAAGC